jgi:hypothetical protein
MRSGAVSRVVWVWVAAVVLGLLAVGVWGQVSSGSAGPGPRATGFVRGPGSPSSAGSFTLTAGLTATRPADMIPLGAVDGARSRGADLIFIGTGSAGQSAEYNLWAVNPLVTPTGVVEAWDRQLVGLVSVVFGTGAGLPGGTVILPTELIAHTATVTPAAYGTAVISAYGAGSVAGVFTPGSNGTAVVMVRDLGNAFGLIVEDRVVTAATAHVLVKTGT